MHQEIHDAIYKVYEVRYNEEEDAYETWLAVTEGYPEKEDFGLEVQFPCNGNYVHYQILKNIARAQDLGYEIVWRV